MFQGNLIHFISQSFVSKYIDAVVVVYGILVSQRADLIMLQDSVTHAKFATLHEKYEEMFKNNTLKLCQNYHFFLFLKGDIWAETSFFGLRWKYLALMEGKVLDITEWANCQKGALSHLQPNSHIVQYRIVLGGQQQQQQQQNQQPHYQQEKKREQTT